jgi:hypothetical protein
MNDKTFVFDEYILHKSKNELIFRYSYEREGSHVVQFEERLVLPGDSNYSLLSTHLLESLHLILGISYYKLYCPKNIKIRNFTLSREQSQFWNTVYTKGLGEFFYVNEIDFRDHINFPFESNKSELPSQDIETEEKALVSVGGGKDSIVSLEIVRESGMPFELFSMNSYHIINDVARVAGKTMHTIQRIIDPQLIEYNKRPDALNGHIPISAIYAFVSILYASINKYKYVVYSNERSSNYGNAQYLGETVSHQWSKSQEFEDLFRSYVQKNITESVEYFSLLRPLYEIQIAKIFTLLPQYFEVFSSSNHNFKMKHDNRNRWDYTSAKTAFVFCLLAAFLPRSHMNKIFGANLFDKPELETFFKEDRFIFFKDFWTKFITQIVSGIISN